MPVVCVTGATSGIGRATVERFVKEGWEAVALGRREERLAALAASVPPGSTCAIATRWSRSSRLWATSMCW